MKPLNLKVSAFGPFAEEISIDFNKFGNNGIILISGDTGSGKTTIFDAITFALFSKTSGNLREVSMLRSDFAQEDVKTYVELKFIYRDEEYVVKKIPEQMVRKKRGEGYTNRAAEAYLYKNGEIIADKKSLVDKKIEEILGINYEQYRQIAMISQGEFRELINADTQKRSEIFRKIFNTKIYENLENNIKIKKSEIQKEYDFYMNDINNSMKKLVKRDLKKMCECLTLEENINFARKYIEREQMHTEQLERYNKSYEKAYHNTLYELESVRENNKKILRFNNIKNEYQNLLSKKEEYILIEKEVERLKKIYLLLQLNEEKEKKYNNVLKLELDISTNKTKIDEMLCIQDEISKKIDESNFKFEQIIPNNIFKISELKLKKEEIKKINENKKKFDELEKNIIEVNDVFNKVKLAYEKKKNEYDKLFNDFLKNSAARIALKLEDGKACDVCGSTVHPSPAKYINGLNLDINIKEIKAELDKLYKKQENLNAELESLKSEYKVLDEILNFNNIEDTDFDKIDLKINELNEEISLIKDERKKHKNKYDEISLKLNDCKLRNIEYFTKKDILLEELLKKENQLNNELEILGLEIRDIKEIDISLDKIEKDAIKISNYKEELLKAKIECSSLENEIKDLEFIDEKKIELKANDRLIKKNNVNRIYNKTRDYYILHSNTLKYLVEVYNKFKSIERKYELYLDLSDVLTGKLVGKDRLSIEKYVQKRYFADILERANSKLFKMTESRYNLLIKEEDYKGTKQVGLDLNIYDNYTNKIRDVKSLSGGESFKAALSLALGLSDIIKEYAGGIKIDTLFIDEGFGSLDETSLDIAINVLNELSVNDVLIGIISHVKELRNRIDKKIIVNKSAYGSNVHIEL